MASMVKVKVKELVPPALDWVLAKVEGKTTTILPPTYGLGYRVTAVTKQNPLARYWPSTDLVQGSELIDKFGVATRKHHRSGHWYAMLSSHLGDDMRPVWSEHRYVDGGFRVTARFDDPSRLVAAMRAIAGWKYGETVEVPSDLLEAAPCK